jgi:hypothetical protein
MTQYFLEQIFQRRPLTGFSCGIMVLTNRLAAKNRTAETIIVAPLTNPVMAVPRVSRTQVSYNQIARLGQEDDQHETEAAMLGDRSGNHSGN